MKRAGHKQQNGARVLSYAIERARSCRAAYGPPPVEAERCAEWIQRWYGVDVYLDQRLPDNVHAVLEVDPSVGAAICVSTHAPWPRWAMCHELGHVEAEALPPDGWRLPYWQFVTFERIANRFAIEFLAPKPDVRELLARGMTTYQAAELLSVPSWVVERQAV